MFLVNDTPINIENTDTKKRNMEAKQRLIRTRRIQESSYFEKPLSNQNKKDVKIFEQISTPEHIFWTETDLNLSGVNQPKFKSILDSKVSENICL